MLESRAIQFLLDELCTTLGLCLPPDAHDALATHPPPDPEAFTDAVLRAEGLDPLTTDRRLYRDTLTLVRKAFAAAEAANA